MKKNYHSSFLLVLMCLFTSFAFAQSGQKLLTIGCLSDLHCEGSNATNGVVKTSVSTTVQRMKQFEDVDVICIGGDITSQTSLSETQWQKCRNSTIDALISAFNKTTASTPLTGAKTATPLVIATGNHEFQACSAPKASYNSADYFNTLGSNSYGMQYYTGDLTSTTTSTVTANANEAFYETLSGNKDFNHVACAHYQINNIDFIIINTSSYNFNSNTTANGWTYSTNQANWVAAKLNKIKADNPKRLVFVVEHFMFSDTNKTNSNHVMPDRDGTPILKKAYASYPNLIMLYGHDHSGSVWISSKTSERVTRYNTSGTKISTTDKNHVDGTTQGTGSVTANSSFMSCFMGSMNYRSNTSLYQALMIYVYEDRIVFQTKDFNESTEANINKNTPYTFFYTDTTAPSEDPEPQGGELGDNEYYIVNGGKYLSNSGESLSLGSTPTAWTFAYSSNQFTVKTDRWLRCESASGSSGSYVFNTSGSSKKVYVFDASGNLVTSQSSLAENTPYYFVYNTGSSTYYYMSNAAFSYSSYTGLTAVKATISGSGSSMKLTVPTSNVSNYQFTLSKSAGSSPEPQPTTVTYYGTLAVSGTNGSVNVSTTSGAAGSSSVNVNKTVENTQANASQTLYLHATANENYEFLGWATSNSESAIISGSNVAEYAYNFTFDGTQSAPTSKTLYAFFKYVESQPSTLGDNEYYIVNGGKYLSNSGESLSLGSTPTAWTFAYSSNQFTVKSDRWLRCEGASGSRTDIVFNTSGSSKNVYIFDASGNLVTSQSSLAENTPYYIVYNTGSSTYYYMSNAAFSYSSYTGLTAVKATITGSRSSMKLTVPTSNVSNYQFTLSKSAGSGPEPQPTTVTYYGTLAVSGTNGSVNVSTTSGAAGSSSVNVNKTVENTQANASQTLYLHATANENYEFLGWATSDSESAIISGSNVAEYAYNFTFDGTQSAPTSKTLYAIFKYIEPQPSGDDDAFYIKSYASGQYLNGTPSNTQNEGVLKFASTKQVWDFESLGNSLVRLTTTVNNVTGNLYQGQYDSYGDYVFKLYNKATDTSAKYNLYLYEISASDINNTSITATKVSAPTAGHYYFIASNNNSGSNPYGGGTASTVNIMSNSVIETLGVTRFVGKAQVGNESNNKITVNVANIKNYIYQFESTGVAPQPTTVTYYGTLAVSGTNGSVNVSTTSGVAGSSSVNVNKTVENTQANASQTLYLHATANENYEFLGWATSNSESAIISGSNVAEYAYNFTFDGTQSAPTSKTLYAFFKQSGSHDDPQSGDGAYYIKNVAEATYLRGENNLLELTSTKFAWNIKTTSAGSYSVKTTDNTCNMYGLTSSSSYFKVGKHPDATDVQYNVNFYEIADINANTLTATKVSTISEGKFYFILGTYTDNSTFVLGNESYKSSSGGDTRLKAKTVTVSSNSISMSKSSANAYIYTLEGTGTSPEPTDEGVYIANGSNFLNMTSTSKLQLDSNQQEWNVIAGSGNTFSIQTTYNNNPYYLYYDYNKPGFVPSTSEQNFYLFDAATGKLATSFVPGNTYYIVVKSGSGSFYMITNSVTNGYLERQKLDNSTSSNFYISVATSGNVTSSTTVNIKSNPTNYQFTFSSNPTPQPTTVTYYGTLAVSGTNGSVNVSTTSGVAGSSSVNVNKTVENTQANASQTLYLHATANEDYEFLGWATSDSESAIISGSNVAEYAYNFTFDGTQSAPTSKTLYAIFKGNDFKMGDVNNDNEIDVSDAVALASLILDPTLSGYNKAAADINNDSEIDVADYVALIDMILAQSASVKETNTESYAKPRAKAESQNVLTLSDVIVVPGGETTFPIAMTNADNTITGIEFNLKLPNGISIPTDEDGDYMVELTSRKGKDHVVSVRLQADGTYKVLCTSISNKAFKDNSGDILNVTVAVDNSFSGSANIALLNVILASPTPATYKQSEVNAEIKAESQNMLALSDVVVVPGGETTFPIAMTNADNTITGIQFNLKLPNGISIPTDEDGDYMVELTSRKGKDHVVNVGLQSDGTYLVLCTSISNKAFKDNAGDILNVTVVADNSIASNVNFSLLNVKLASPKPATYKQSEVNAEMLRANFVAKDNADNMIAKAYKEGDAVELNDGQYQNVNVIEDINNVNLTYKRTFNSTDWQALYVPFALNVNSDLSEFDVYEFITISKDKVYVSKLTGSITEPNTPYFIKAKEATGLKTISLSGMTLVSTKENTSTLMNFFDVVGTYNTLECDDVDGDWYALKGGKFQKAADGATLNPFRFYLKAKAGASVKEGLSIAIEGATGIASVDEDINANGNLFNVAGQSVRADYKGVVIVNGKKVLKK